MNHPARRPSLALLLLPLLPLLPTACSDDGRTPLVIYSPHGPDIGAEFEALFEAAHPDVDVRYQGLETGAILTRVRGESANPGADVWWGAPASTFTIAAEEGLLETYRPTWIDRVDALYRDAEDRFAPHFIIPQILIYNRDRMAAEEAPRSWDDLTADEYHGRIVLRNPPPSGSMRGAFSWLVAWKAGNDLEGVDRGFEYLRAVHRNTKKYGAQPRELFEAIKRDRDRVVGMWNLADAIFQRDRYEYPFGIVVPEEGVPIVIDCIAIVKDEDRDPARAAAARAFYEFVTSLESGRKLMHEHGRMLVRDDVPADDLPAWHAEYAYRPLPVESSFAAEHADAWMARWEAEVKPMDRDGP
ncbi:MAG: extracellular solute-binding protein [Planctomycetota bacterium JB042]